MPRYNKAINPAAANGVTGFSGTGLTRITGQTVGTTGRTTAAQNTTTAAVGGLNISGGRATCTNSQTWTLVGWVMSSVDRTITPISTVANNGSYVGNAGIGSDVALTAGTWTQIRMVVTTPASGTFNQLSLAAYGGTTGTAGTVALSAIRIEQTNDPTLTFADGSSGGTWSWDGTAGDSTSTQADAPVVDRYNRSRNPSCDLNTTDWGSGATVTRVTGQTITTTGKTTAGAVATTTAAFGVYLAGGGAAVSASGQTWSVVGYVYCTVARTIRPSVSTWNGATFVATTATQADVALTAGIWTRVRFVFTTPTGTYTSIRLHVDLPTTGTAGTLRMGAIRFEQGNYPTLEFGDGSSGGSWSWDGTAGNSTSTERGSVPITVYSATSGSTVVRPTVAQRHPLNVRAANTAGTSTRPTLPQRSTLAVRTASSTSPVARPTVAQRHTLLARSAMTASTVTAPSLGLAVRSAMSSSTVVRPLLAQRSVLLIRLARTDGAVTRPTLSQRITLLLRSANTATTARRITLTQRSTLLVRAVRTASTATRPIIRFRAGTPVQVPTTVVVATRFGTADVTHRQGDVDAPDRAGDVAVDVRGQVAVETRYGTVLETSL